MFFSFNGRDFAFSRGAFVVHFPRLWYNLEKHGQEVRVCYRSRASACNTAARSCSRDVHLKFTSGNCYGIIGANGAGKSTFLKVLSGEIEPNKGEVTLGKNERMSVLAQDQNKYDFETVLRTVMLGHKRLVEVMDEKDALYAHAEFTEEDGVRAAELESEFAELGGWEAESEAETLLNELDIPSEYHYLQMGELDAKQKVRVLLAQALFETPTCCFWTSPPTTST